MNIYTFLFHLFHLFLQPFLDKTNTILLYVCFIYRLINFFGYNRIESHFQSHTNCTTSSPITLIHIHSSNKLINIFMKCHQPGPASSITYDVLSAVSITLSIHGTNFWMFVYTPGRCSRPHPIPHDTNPISVFRPSKDNVNGPPESPWHESRPP